MKIGALFFATFAVVVVSPVGPAKSASPQLPVELEQTSDIISFASIGIGESGAFTVGPYDGKFKRRLKTQSNKWFGLTKIGLARQEGKTEFALRGGDLNGPLAGSCRLSQADISFAGLDAESQPFAMRCELRDDGSGKAALLELDAKSRTPGFQLKRTGTIKFGGEVIEIRSIHKPRKGSKTELPLGYEFLKDGAPVAAVDVDGKKHVRFARGIDPQTRRSLLAAATALALTWNPAL